MLKRKRKKVDASYKEKNPLEFKEVQENMSKNNMHSYIQETKDKWMTPDLLGKVQGNTNLLQSLADPEIMQAVALMQVNPKQAKEKFKDNKKVTEFFIEFSKLMGNHFEDLSAKEQSQNSNTTKSIPEEKKPLIQEVKSSANTKMTSSTSNKTSIISKPSKQQTSIDFSSADPVLAKKLENPTVKALLQEPKIQSFLASLHKGPPLDFHALMRYDPELGMKVRYLLENGVLQAQSQK